VRILIISARYLPHRGGLETVVYHLAQEFSRQGHTVRIVTNRYPRTLSARETVDGIQVTRLHFLLPGVKYLKNFRLDLWLDGLWYRFFTERVLRYTIKEFRPDVINNHYLNEVAEFTGRCLTGQHPPIPWVISFHGGDVDGEPFQSRANKMRFSRLSQQADGLTACSRFLAAQAQALEPTLHGKIEVIHNGVDVQRFSEANDYPAHQPNILAVGQLESHKGFDLLVEAFAQVAEKYLQVQLWIAGEGSQRMALEETIRQQELGNQVKLLGRVDERQVASLMAGCLFVTMPSRYEAFGMVALEGMAAGKVVLASPVGGLPEFLPEPPNRLVAPEPTAWSVALDELLALAMSGQLKAEENAQQACKYDWACVANRYLQAYEKAIRVD
jgi:glycosyltransferase involved in cell wall biosynthesis